MTEPQRLYGTTEIAEILGVKRARLIKDARQIGPKPDFIFHYRGMNPIQLYTLNSLNQWRAFYASDASIRRKPSTYSDHRAVNQLGGTVITWKLWWRNTHDGGAMWWFSTPQGWYVSNDDGRSWDFADVMIRPGDYRYHCVTGNVTPGLGTLVILRSAEKLRRRIEKGETQWLTTKFVPGLPSTNSKTA